MNEIDTLIRHSCPDGVPYFSLGQLEDCGRIKLGRGQIISKIEMAENPGPYPVYSSSATNNGCIGTYGKYMFDDERITWSVDGGGKFFYRNNEKYSVTNVGGWLKVLDKNLSTRYLYHVLLLQWMKKVFDYVHKAHPSVIRDEYIIPVPPIDVQNKIVHVLDNFTDLILTLTDELEMRKEQYAFYKKKLLCNESFPLRKIKDICNVCSGGTPSKTKPEYWEGGTIKWLGSTVCQNVKEIKEVTGYITEEGLDHSSAKIMKPGTTLIAMVGATIGKTAFLTFESTTNQNIACLYPKNTSELDCEFLFYAIQTLYKKFYDLGAGKLTIASLSFIKDLEIFVPAIEKQKEIVKILNSFEDLTNNHDFGLPAEIDARQKQYEHYCEQVLSFKENQ